MGPDAKLFFALLYVLFVGLPTLLFYAWPVLFGGLAVRQCLPGRTKALAIAFALVAFAPLAAFSTAYHADMKRNQALIDLVRAGAELPKLETPPRVLTVHGGHADWQDRLIEMGAFDAIYLAGREHTTKLANMRVSGCDGGIGGNYPSKHTLRARTAFLVCATELRVNGAPNDGLHLYLRPQGETHKHAEASWSGLYDLRWIEGGAERQVGFFGRPQVRTPVTPPILSLNGFERHSEIVLHAVPWYGEIEFLSERLNIKPSDLKPLAQPSAEEVHAEFLRRRDSEQQSDRQAAAFIAEAVGASALTAEDIAPLLTTNLIDNDLAREIGFQQFCPHIDRLCDFPDALVGACKVKRGYLPENVSYRSDALLRCERIPQMCQWCASAQLCQPHLTGQRTGCADAESQARDAALRELRSH